MHKNLLDEFLAICNLSFPGVFQMKKGKLLVGVAWRSQHTPRKLFGGGRDLYNYASWLEAGLQQRGGNNAFSLSSRHFLPVSRALVLSQCGSVPWSGLLSAQFGVSSSGDLFWTKWVKMFTGQSQNSAITLSLQGLRLDTLMPPIS